MSMVIHGDPRRDDLPRKDGLDRDGRGTDRPGCRTPITVIARAGERSSTPRPLGVTQPSRRTGSPAFAGDDSLVGVTFVPPSLDVGAGAAS